MSLSNSGNTADQIKNMLGTTREPSERFKEALQAKDEQIGKLTRALRAITAERDDLARQKDEHQAEFPNGCTDASQAPAENTYCPGTGTSDHAEHSILCYRVAD